MNNINLASKQILNKISIQMPKLAVILGSGLSDIVDDLEKSVTIAYKDLEGFPVPTVKGHKGELVIGLLKNTPILFLNGRVHAYETDDFTALKTMIRTLKNIGIETLMTTSSSGSLNEDMPTGSIMLISDHINFMGVNPLQGKNDDDFGTRFPALGDAWSTNLRAKIKKLDDSLYEGVYFAFRGPNFETPAEIRMAKIMGGDAVGMSAVPECIIANHCGLKAVGFAVISNMAEGMTDELLNHNQTLEGAKKALENLKNIIGAFVIEYYTNSIVKL